MKLRRKNRRKKTPMCVAVPSRRFSKSTNRIPIWTNIRRQSIHHNTCLESANSIIVLPISQRKRFTRNAPKNSVQYMAQCNFNHSVTNFHETVTRETHLLKIVLEVNCPRSIQPGDALKPRSGRNTSIEALAVLLCLSFLLLRVRTGGADNGGPVRTGGADNGGPVMIY